MTAERADRERTVARVAMIFVLGVVWFGPAVEATFALLLGRHWDWADALTRAVTFGASMAIALPLVWWMANSNGERSALRRSLAAGALPPYADPGEWAPHLRSELTRLKLARWLLAGSFIAEAALLAAVAMTTDESTSGLWLATCVAVVWAAVSPLWGSRRRQVVEGLRAQLPQP